MKPKVNLAGAVNAPVGKNPPKAYENKEFIHSPEGRSVRVLSELIEPEQRLRRYHIRNTVVFFGSARILSAEKAHGQLAEAEERAKNEANAETEKLLEKARTAVDLSRYYEDARQLAGDITRWSKSSTNGNPFYVCSGGGPGIMEAANRGASEAGGITLGLGISLPYEQTNNPYITQGLGFEFHYFFVRKYWFLSLARALIVFPGGFGTMDELFELLTLVQTRKVSRNIPILLYGSEFWNELFSFNALFRRGLIEEADVKLFKIVDSVDEARDFILNTLSVTNSQHF
ncbi:MAG: TIGR00730 family Rossman fold protein [Puniceicoccales bacterium]|jgi:uncharacterized protein (TIGR00730 family)|nr:TIGR00730 family Rossman fold protein [Puniceicoccales bacterium]